MGQESERTSRRWWICGALFVATALSFLDRQVLSVLASEVTKRLGMSNLEYSHVNTAFLVSYAAMFLLGGRMMDLLGTRLGMALSVGLWSIASAAHAAVQNAFQLGACRFLLGIGEGGCFPGAAKGVAESFDQRQRALGMGIAIGGASLGAVAAPPLTVWLARAMGWRGVFIVTGCIGAVWVAAWWFIARELRRRREESAASPPIVCNVETASEALEPDDRRVLSYQAPSPQDDRPSMGSLLQRADVWGLALMRFIVDPVFYFYMFWIPKYLVKSRGVTLQQIGEVAWIPFLALGVSNIIGGLASDGLIRGGMGVFNARRLVMGGAALLTVASSFTGFVGGLSMALAMMSLLMLAHGFWITNYVTLISDRFPKGAVGTVMGFSGAIGALGGMLANTAIGWCVDRFDYGPIWLASGLMYPAAFGVLLLMLGPGLATNPQMASQSQGSTR